MMTKKRVSPALVMKTRASITKIIMVIHKIIVVSNFSKDVIKACVKFKVLKPQTYRIAIVF